MTFFDLRVPLGWLFVILGGLLVVAGFRADSGTDVVSLGININLYWGPVMMAFGGVCLWLARGSVRKRGGGDGEKPTGSQ